MPRTSYDLGDFQGNTKLLLYSDNTRHYIGDEKGNAIHRVVDACSGAAVAAFGPGCTGAEVDQVDAIYKPIFEKTQDSIVAMDKTITALMEKSPKLAFALAKRLPELMTVTPQGTTAYAMHLRYTFPNAVLAAEELIKAANDVQPPLVGDEKFGYVMLLSSGSEVNDTAMKAAFACSGKKRKLFLTLNNSYHGNTIGSLTLSGFEVRKKPYEGLLKEDLVQHIERYYPFRDRKGQTLEDYEKQVIKILEQTVDDAGGENIAAIFLEPVSGAALGCQALSPGFLKRVKELCVKHDIYLGFDEVMCGNWRADDSHPWHPIQKSLNVSIAPDIITMGKTLGAGIVPAAAILVNEKIKKGLKKEGYVEFVHGHTHQSHNLIATAVLVVQHILRHLIPHIKEMGKFLEKELKTQLGRNTHVGDIRGKGLFWGVEFVKDNKVNPPEFFGKPVSSEIATWASGKPWGLPDENGIKSGVDVYPGSWTVGKDCGSFMIFSPPYVYDNNDIRTCVSMFKEALEQFPWSTIE